MNHLRIFHRGKKLFELKIIYLKHYFAQMVQKVLDVRFDFTLFEYHKDSFLVCLAVFIYQEDPRGKLPKAIWSWAAKVR